MKSLQSLLKGTHKYHPGYTIISHRINSSLISETLLKTFHESLPSLLGEVKHESKYLNNVSVEAKLKKASEHNLNSGGKFGGVTLLQAYGVLVNTGIVPEQAYQQAIPLAWAVEMVQSHNWIMETATNEDTKSIEPNADDADLLRSFTHIMIEKRFRDSKWLMDFMELFNKAYMYNAVVRQIQQAAQSPNYYNDFTEERYDMLCELKAAYLSFTLPVTLAMKLANRSDEKHLACVARICSDMGKLYQMKKDYTDCFGGEDIIGTSGTSIQRGRHTWLATAALQRLTAQRRVVLTACYGSAAPAHIERVKLLYKQLDLPKLFVKQQELLVCGIKKNAADLEEVGVPSSVFLKILDEILQDDNVFNN